MESFAVMASLSPYDFTMWRCACGLHAFRRLQERGIPMTMDDIEHLNGWIERMKPVFVIDGQTRYRIGVHRANGERMRVIYDIALESIVTVLTRPNTKWPAPMRSNKADKADKETGHE